MTFRHLDPLLPDVVDPGEGERISASVPGRGFVHALLYRADYEGASTLWHARTVWEWAPLAADVGAAGMAALAKVVRARVRRERPGPDSACAVVWPSGDLAAASALAAGGFVPSTVLAVRDADRAGAEFSGSGVVIRQALTTDIDDLVGLWLSELQYSALVGPALLRPDTPALLGRELRRALGAGEPVWVAESDGVPAGMAVCRWPEPLPRRLPGLWALVGTVSVAPNLRGRGIGRTLMSVVHRVLSAQRGTRGTYLFYSPHNALSSVFWHRQGYRPLWTTWEVRPATVR